MDASKGVLVQTRRHTRICALMGIKHVVYAVNKMDLIDYDENEFKNIAKQIKIMTGEDDFETMHIIPVSATVGDNITTESAKTPWYKGGTLQNYLETIDVTDHSDETGFVMPVQRVSRPDRTFRGFQGQVEVGEIHVGDEITSLPSGETAQVKSILNTNKEVDNASKGQAVTIQLDREVDVSRGCVLTNKEDLPYTKDVTTTLLWMDDEPLSLGKEYLVKLGTKKIPGMLKSIEYKIDVNSGEHIQADHVEKNEIAVCHLEFAEKIIVDKFKTNKTLGELILIDRISHATSACGVVEDVSTDGEVPYFQKDDIKTGGYIFEEFYFNLENAFLSKVNTQDKTYHVGDTVPIEGDSFKYPDYFDILAADSDAVILIRNRVIEDIIPLSEYQYTGLPVLDERGFALRIRVKADLDNYLYEYKNLDKENHLEFFNKWSKFETYRRIICTDNFWMI